MFERLDAAARDAVHEAQLAAHELKHHYLGTEHLLLGVLADPTTQAALLLAAVGVDRAAFGAAIVNRVGPGYGARPSPDELLATFGIDLAEIRRRAEENFGTDAVRRATLRARTRRRRARRSSQSPCQSALDDARWLAFCPRAKRALELAARRADSRRQLVTPTHLLAGILAVPDAMAPLLLRDLGIDNGVLLAAADAALDQPAA